MPAPRGAVLNLEIENEQPVLSQVYLGQNIKNCGYKIIFCANSPPQVPPEAPLPTEASAHGVSRI